MWCIVFASFCFFLLMSCWGYQPLTSVSAFLAPFWFILPSKLAHISQKLWDKCEELMVRTQTLLWSLANICTHWVGIINIHDCKRVHYLFIYLFTDGYSCQSISKHVYIMVIITDYKSGDLNLKGYGTEYLVKLFGILMGFTTHWVQSTIIYIICDYMYVYM